MSASPFALPKTVKAVRSCSIRLGSYLVDGRRAVVSTVTARSLIAADRNRHAILLELRYSVDKGSFDKASTLASRMAVHMRTLAFGI